MTMVKKLAIFGAIGAWLPLAACPCDTAGAGVELACTVSSDCPPGSGQTCVGGHCVGSSGGSGSSNSGTSSGSGTTGSGSSSSSGTSSRSGSGTSTSGPSSSSSSGTTSASSSSSTVSSSNGSSTNNSSGASSHSGSTSASSSGSTTSGSGTTASSSGSGTACTPGATPSRVLATAISQNGGLSQVWDISNPTGVFPFADATSLLGGGDWLSAVAITSDGEILALSAFDGLFAFNSCGKYLGSIQPIFQNGYYKPSDGSGIAFLPQSGGGPAVVVMCDANDGPVAFYYNGAGDFDGGMLDAPATLWPASPTGGGSFQCFPGPGNTVYVAGTDSSGNAALDQFQALTGGAATGITPPLSDVYGGAMDTSGNVLITGDDQTQAGSDFGAAELYNSNPTAIDAVTGAPTCADLGNCIAGSCNCATGSMPLWVADSDGDVPGLGQAAALPSGGFVAVFEDVSNFGSGTPYSTIVQLQPGSSGLTVTNYYTGGPMGPTFFGLASAP